MTNAVTSLTDARMSATTVLTSRGGAPVSLVGAPLLETHTSFTLVPRVVRVIRAAMGVEGTLSRTMAMPLGEEGAREPRGATRASDASPVLVPAAALQRATVATVAAEGDALEEDRPIEKIDIVIPARPRGVIRLAKNK
jgi:hypothetical protein